MGGWEILALVILAVAVFTILAYYIDKWYQWVIADDTDDWKQGLFALPIFALYAIIWIIIGIMTLGGVLLGASGVSDILKSKD